MKTPNRFVVIIATATLLAAVAKSTAPAQGQPLRIGQARIADKLVNGTAIQRRQALESVFGVAPQLVELPLRQALMKTLQREAAAQVNRVESRQRGEMVPDEVDPEFVADLANVVARLRDRSSIAALASAASLGIGSGEVEDAFAEFADAAVPSVVAIVRSNPSPYAIQDGLLVLRHMVEESATRPLSAASLAEIRTVAKLRLTKPARLAESGVTLNCAIDLAMTLHDAELTAIVRNLGTNRASVVEQGISDEHGIQWTQRTASERLAGQGSRRRK
jgi:hypothetical protein